jgi:hypothetical protein
MIDAQQSDSTEKDPGFFGLPEAKREIGWDEMIAAMAKLAELLPYGEEDEEQINLGVYRDKESMYKLAVRVGKINPNYKQGWIKDKDFDLIVFEAINYKPDDPEAGKAGTEQKRTSWASFAFSLSGRLSEEQSMRGEQAPEPATLDKVFSLLGEYVIDDVYDLIEQSESTD